MRGVAVGSEQRALIWALHEEGKSYAAIKEVVKLSKSTVQHVIKAMQKERAALNKAKPFAEGQVPWTSSNGVQNFCFAFYVQVVPYLGSFQVEKACNQSGQTQSILGGTEDQ